MRIVRFVDENGQVSYGQEADEKTAKRIAGDKSSAALDASAQVQATRLAVCRSSVSANRSSRSCT